MTDKLLKAIAFLFLILLFTTGFSCGWSVGDDDSVPDYDLVFPQDKVNRIDIKIEPDDWQTMLDDMTLKYGEFGSCSYAEDFWSECGSTLDWPDTEPVYVPCKVHFGDDTWEHVGIRFKGASTLAKAWLMGIYKIPFKLDFDHFEDEYPETRNQRFYGFKRLSFANGSYDKSYLRAKVCLDLFREEGIPTPKTSFYRVFIDKGEGPLYFGLYTMTEMPGRAMFITQFGESGGNLYKPIWDGGLAWRLEAPVDEYSFPKKSNETDADYSDIEETITAVHADRSDISSWRDNLDTKIDTQGLIKWLGVNTVLEIWDISGNHYLYGDPSEEGRIHWIPWDPEACMPDYDITIEDDPFLGYGLYLDLSNVSSAIPLITYLLEDPMGMNEYRSEVEDFAGGNFSITSMNERLDREHDLIAPYVLGEDGESPGFTFTDGTDFEDELDFLKDYIIERHADIDAYL